MPPDAEKLITENINKNIVNSDAYPAASVIHNRCILMSMFDLKLILDLRYLMTTYSCGSLEST